MTEIEDPFLWLEDVTGAEAMRWVRERNQETVADLGSGERFETLVAEFREVLTSRGRIPLVRRRGEFLYNLWRDATHRKGLWRRTSLESYRDDSPVWEPILDVDALAAAEGRSWVWKGAKFRWPDLDRCLITLSIGGSDAVVVREFDLGARMFVADGFALAQASSQMEWIDADTVLVATDFGPGSLTDAGYPRIVKRWTRGEPLSEAVTVFEVGAADVRAYIARETTPGQRQHTVLERWIRSDHSEEFLLRSDGQLTRLDVPLDADLTTHRGWLTVRLRTEWLGYPAGSLLATDLDVLLAGERAFSPVFQPSRRMSLRRYSWLSDHLLLQILDDVKGRLSLATPGPHGEWDVRPVRGLPDYGMCEIVGTSPRDGNEFYVRASSFLQPATLLRGEGHQAVEALHQASASFDAEGMSVVQHFATSADGTSVPYFVIGKLNDEAAPTLLTGYGGFEVSMTPSYSGVLGRGWLARGGRYVLANIRGGGEYGPGWHQAAVREDRPRAFEDFAAVASDLIARGLTRPAQLGIMGTSNGGLLMGNMLTRHPELFAAVVCRVPVFDMRRYHVLHAGAAWMSEWGDPDNPDDWVYLSTYSPYHLLDPALTLPPVLMTTSTRDDRVHPGHARKMAARMSEQDHRVWYYENIDGGHAGAADSSESAMMWGLWLAFLWRHVGPARSL